MPGLRGEWRGTSDCAGTTADSGDVAARDSQDPGSTGRVARIGTSGRLRDEICTQATTKIYCLNSIYPRTHISRHGRPVARKLRAPFFIANRNLGKSPKSERHKENMN